MLRALLELRAHLWGVVPPEVLGAREQGPVRGYLTTLVLSKFDNVLNKVVRRVSLGENEGITDLFLHPCRVLQGRFFQYFTDRFQFIGQLRFRYLYPLHEPEESAFPTL